MRICSGFASDLRPADFPIHLHPSVSVSPTAHLNAPALDPAPEAQRQPAVVDRSEPRLDLRATLPYLLGRAGTGLADAFNEEMRQYGISLQVWRILASLLWRDRQRITELALNTSIEVSTVSRLVAANVRRGLLTRQRAGDDARSVEIALTDSGRELVQQVVPIFRLYERVALAGIDEADVQTLKRLLVKVYDNIASLGVSQGTRSRPRKSSPV